jgi:hypothetical protein
MSIAVPTYAERGGREPGLLARLFAPVLALRQSYVETEEAVAKNLLSLDDGTLHMLGYNRADLKAGIVRSLRAD